ncbi:hypothetical protein GGI20_004121 [Coemansia sp. BCRC 34301]|nr:hypothetical protein GGI20_004121 [Coemansia sp. BCRC 34301]
MDLKATGQADLNKGDAEEAENQLHADADADAGHVDAALATHENAAPEKTYAAAVLLSPPSVIVPTAEDAHAVDANTQQRAGAEYYSDEYTEDSVFSDSIYDEDDDEEDEDDDGSSDVAAEHIPADAPPDAHANDSRLGSGASTPNPVNLHNLTRTAEALAPSHRFVSHTPWGSSTGRLTRDQRHKGRMWDDPNADSAAPHDDYTPTEQYPTFVDNNRASAAHEMPLSDRLAVEAEYADAAVASREQIARLTHQLHYQQQRLRQMQEQMQQRQQPLPALDSAASQVVNVVPVQQGSKNYNQLQQQMQNEQPREALDSSLDAVAANVVSTNIRRFFGGIGETILAKYGATLMAYYLLSRPLCTPGRRLASDILHDPAAVMMSYSRNSAYLINLSQATTRLLLMLNDLPKFVWSTVKVDRLLRSLDVHARYRSAVENLSEQNSNDSDDRSSNSSG